MHKHVGAAVFRSNFTKNANNRSRPLVSLQLLILYLHKKCLSNSFIYVYL